MNKWILLAILGVAFAVAVFGIGSYWLSITTFAFVSTLITASIHAAILGGLVFAAYSVIRSKQ